MPFWQYVLLFAYWGNALTMMRSYASTAPEKACERIIVVETSPVGSLLFLNNNLHMAHHEVPCLPGTTARLLPRRPRAADRQELRLSHEGLWRDRPALVHQAEGAGRPSQHAEPAQSSVYRETKGPPLDLPKSAAYVVVGVGMHGMSTAWHLAMALESSGKGKGSDVVLHRQDRPRCRRDRHRLRLRAQPLHDLAAPHHPAPFGRCLAVGPGQLRLPAGRLRLGGRSQPAGRLREDAQEPERRRLPVRHVCRQGCQEASSSPCGPTSMSSVPTSCCTRSRPAMPAPISPCRACTTSACSGASGASSVRRSTAMTCRTAASPASRPPTATSRPTAW